MAYQSVSICCYLCSQGEEALVLRKCFEGVQRDGELIQVRDTVLLKSGPRKKSLPYVAKISALWEEPESGRTHAVRCSNTITGRICCGSSNWSVCFLLQESWWWVCFGITVQNTHRGGTTPVYIVRWEVNPFILFLDGSRALCQNHTPGTFKHSSSLLCVKYLKWQRSTKISF